MLSAIFTVKLLDSVPALKPSSQGETNGILNSSSKTKGLPRRVSFPDDDKIISGYGEPRNPWAHGNYFVYP